MDIFQNKRSSLQNDRMIFYWKCVALKMWVMACFLMWEDLKKTFGRNGDFKLKNSLLDNVEISQQDDHKVSV